MPTPMQNELNTLAYRVENAEKHLTRLDEQFDQYERKSENALNLRAIRESVDDIKQDVSEIRKWMNEIAQKLIAQDQEAEKREKERIQREAVERQRQDKQQIQILVWVVTTIVAALLAIFVGYVTHFFH